MLEMKENCESCSRRLAWDQVAYICSHECTFCPSCVRGPLGRICPNCGGELVRRPFREGNGPKFRDIEIDEEAEKEKARKYSQEHFAAQGKLPEITEMTLKGVVPKTDEEKLKFELMRALRRKVKGDE